MIPYSRKYSRAIPAPRGNIGLGPDDSQVDEKRPHNPGVQPQGNPETDQPVFQEPGRPLAVVGSRYEIGRDEQEQPHEICLVDRAEPGSQRRADLILAALGVDPTAAARVDDHQVVKDHQDGQEDADIVDKKEPPARRGCRLGHFRQRMPFALGSNTHPPSPPSIDKPAPKAPASPEAAAGPHGRSGNKAPPPAGPPAGTSAPAAR